MCSAARRLSFLCLVATACAGGEGGDGPGPVSADTGRTCGQRAWGDPTLLPLPAGAPAGAFAEVQHEAADCDAGRPLTWLRDLTGDGIPDLVALLDCDDPTVGTDHWRVWAGTGSGFAEGAEWTLPEGYATGTFSTPLRLTPACDVGEPAYFVDEITGDGVVDLVVTASCEDATVGDTTWLVHAGGAEGFGAAQVWTLPEGTSTGAWVTPQTEPDCLEANVPAWGVTDLTGDGALDLVVTASCVDPEIGRMKWQVYPGGAAALAEAVDWSVPMAVLPDVTGRTNAQCGESRPAFFLFDVDDTPGPEMVVPLACTSLGSDWTVYPNVGVGFGEAQSYAAPYGTNYQVTAPERETTSCSTSTPSWLYDDMDGDGRADLTFTGSCEDPSVGDAWWLLARGGVDGLGALGPVDLPAGYSAGSFDTTRSTERSCNGTANHPAWLLEDLDGDGALELVVTSSCEDPDVGTTSWLVRSLDCVD